MSNFLTNTIEVSDIAEPAPPARNPYAPQYLPHPRYNGVNIFSYYNPYLQRRVKVLNFGPGVIPALDNNTVLDTLALDHYIQHNNIHNSPDYIKIQGITHKLKERNYRNAPSEEKIRNIKSQMNVAQQHWVDEIARIFAMRVNYVPQTLHDKIVAHAMAGALGPRFRARGGKKKTLKSKNGIRKTRMKKNK